MIVIDVQNDFATPSGSLYVRGGEEVVPRVNQEVATARDTGAFVAYTQDWHPPTTPHFMTDGGVWPVHCVRDTWGAELHPELRVDGPVVRKGTGGEDGYSGFTTRDPTSGEEASTELEALLRDRGVEQVVIGGLATDYCVRATALDAHRLGFQTTVLTDAIRAVDLAAGDGERAIEELRAAGVTIA